MMASVRSKDTMPELWVRRLVHSLGYRFRLHRRDLPGTPDLVFPRLRKVIFVHGCFWHQHGRCRAGHVPRSNVAYWIPKLTGNVARDRLNLRRLRQAGWNALTVWECELHRKKLPAKIRAFLESA